MRKILCKTLVITLAAMMMCSSAFAAITITGDYDSAEALTGISVTGLADTATETAVLVVPAGQDLAATDLADKIMYIDQISATSTDADALAGVVAKFRTTDATATSVDVYVGQAGSVDNATKATLKLSNAKVVTYTWSTAPALAAQAGKASQIDAATIAVAIVKNEDGTPVSGFTADAAEITATVKQADSVYGGMENKSIADINGWIAGLDAAVADLSVEVKYAGAAVGTALELDIAAPAALESISFSRVKKSAAKFSRAFFHP